MQELASLVRRVRFTKDIFWANRNKYSAISCTGIPYTLSTSVLEKLAPLRTHGRAPLVIRNRTAIYRGYGNCDCDRMSACSEFLGERHCSRPTKPSRAVISRNVTPLRKMMGNQTPSRTYVNRLTAPVLLPDAVEPSITFAQGR